MHMDNARSVQSKRRQYGFDRSTAVPFSTNFKVQKRCQRNYRRKELLIKTKSLQDGVKSTQPAKIDVNLSQ